MPSFRDTLRKKAKRNETFIPMWERYLKLEDRFRKLGGKNPEMPVIKDMLHRTQRALYLGHPSEEKFSRSNMERALGNIEFGLDNGVFGREINGNRLSIELVLKPKSMPNHESVWIGIVRAKDEQIARIGLNFHAEYGVDIMSIVTIQGKRGSPTLSKIKRAMRRAGQLWTLEAVSMITESLSENVGVVRGVPSTLHPFSQSKGFHQESTIGMYDGTFQKLGMEMVYNSQNPRITYYELLR